jgi:hypothetical protein
VIGARRSAAIATVAFALTMGACLDEPFLRDNPLDADADVHLEILGLPDTIHARGVSVIASLSSSEPLPDGAEVRWAAPGLTAFSSGLIFAHASTIQKRVVRVSASLGPLANPRVVTKDVVHWQRPYSIRLGCQPSCDMPGIGGIIHVGFQTLDSLGTPVAGYPFRPAGDTLAIRDTLVVQHHDFLTSDTVRLRSRTVGETWFVWRAAQHRTLLDSIKIRVEQVPTTLSTNCEIWINRPATTGQIDVLNIRDGYGHPLLGPWPDIEWLPGVSIHGTGTVEVSPSGAITVIEPEVTWYATARVVGQTTVIGGCVIYAP